MTHCIIRTYDKQQHIAIKCYESMVKHNVADSYIFWADEGDCSLLKATDIPVVYHESCGNFGGLKYCKVMINALSNFIVEPDDYVIFCDDDITMLRNPMPDMINFDHGGIFGQDLVCDNIPHVSGQLNIIKGWLWNEYIKGSEYILDLIYRYQCTHNSQAGTVWNREAEWGLSYRKPEYQAGDVDMQGHFISENYFKAHRSTILNTLKLTPKWESYINDKYGELLSGNTCSIHVRRTDYLQPDQMATHGVLDKEYYWWASQQMYADNYPSKFIVCSDDIEWCKENIKGPSVVYIESEPDIIDLFIMSKCKNHIIANSTFSWWAAWLSGNKTVAPKHFFVDGTTWPGMYKEDWIVI